MEKQVTDKFKFDNIILEKDRIIIDGQEIDGNKIYDGVHIHWGGEGLIGPAVTLTLVADTVTLTDEVREHHEAKGRRSITETGTPQ